jgi:hypothetical protein
MRPTLFDVEMLRMKSTCDNGHHATVPALTLLRSADHHPNSVGDGTSSGRTFQIDMAIAIGSHDRSLRGRIMSADTKVAVGEVGLLLMSPTHL